MLNSTRISVLMMLFLFGQIRSQTSPCPRYFAYEPQKEPDRWFGVVTLTSDSNLSGVWLRLIFDRPSIQLGNWFGDIKTTDNKEYLIKNRNHQLKANMPYSLRFYIKYNAAEPPPRLIAIRLNAKTICPEGEATTEPAITGGQLITSNALESSTQNPPLNNWQVPGGGGGGDTDDDVFQGDFQLVNQPNQPALNKPVPSNDFECGTVVSHGRDKRQTNYYQPYDVYGMATFLNFYHYMTLLLNNMLYFHRVPVYVAPIPLQIKPRPLITHGQPTSEGEFPWHAALYHEKGADLQYICGGSLISKSVVITAAHCVTRKRSQYTIRPESLVVYLGKHYLRRWSNAGIQDTQVGSIVPHPDYNPQTFANDIALIKLVNPIMISDYVRPVCLWEGSTSINSVLNEPGTVVGWGYDHTGKVSESLMQTKMPVILKETCIYSFPDFFSRYTTTSTYCAGFRNGTSVCNGDSGGGMVFPKPSAVQGRKAWQIRGLVSLSVALQNKLKCDASHYAVFTDVASYLNWIKDVMAN